MTDSTPINVTPDQHGDSDPQRAPAPAKTSPRIVGEVLNRDSIQRRLRQLAEFDPDRWVFGSGSHDYKLNPPARLNEIEAFEKSRGVSLPDEYRWFITEIGNGGAGPAYGLLPFGTDDEGPWDEGQLIGDVGKPFPHNETWNLDDDFWKQEPHPPAGIDSSEEDRLWEEWDRLLEAEYWTPSIMNGAIPICHLGCALRQWLVVHGEQRGTIWDDKRADNAGISPVRDASCNPMTFGAWYLNWLDEVERECEAQRTRLASHGTKSRRTELLVVLILIAAGVLLGMLRPLLH